MEASGLRAGLRRYAVRRRGSILAIGFTMIEMMIVMAIIGTLLAIALPMFQGALDKAHVARAIGDIGALQTDIAAFEAGGKGLPETLDDIGRGTLLDPWGNPYQYIYPGERMEFEIWSHGADGVEGGEEGGADIGNWDDK